MSGVIRQTSAWMRRKIGFILGYERPGAPMKLWHPYPVDPLEPIALLTGLDLSKLRAQGGGRIVLSLANFAEWMDAETRAAPGFRSRECFRTVIGYLTEHGPVEVTNAVARVDAYVGPENTVLLDVVPHVC